MTNSSTTLLYAVAMSLALGWLVVPVLTCRRACQSGHEEVQYQPRRDSRQAGEGVELEVRTADVQHGSMSRVGN